MRKSFEMASTKVTAFALLFLLQSHWILCQYYNGYGGYGYPPPPITYCSDNDNSLDLLLPILLIAMCNNGGLGGCAPYPYLAGGCGGCGCGGCGGCGCGGGCGGCGRGCSCGCGGGCGCCCC